VRVGVNGWRVHGWTGVPRYLKSIIVHWTPDLLARRGHEVIVYSSKAKPSNEPWTSDGIRYRVLTPELPMLAWETAVLGPRVRDDVLWCPGFTRPLYSRSKVVVTTHDLGPWLYPDLYGLRGQLFDGRWHKWSARHAALVITDNENTKEDIAKHYRIGRDRIRVIPLAPAAAFRRTVDPAQSRATRVSLFGFDVPFFLNVGTQSKRRNVPRIVAGFARFKQETRHPHRLVLVGKGNADVDIAAVARSLGVANEVIHLEFVGDPRLNEIYNAADAFVMAATYDATSLTLLEAQITGTPVLIPNVAGLRAVSGDNALVYGDASEDAIAAALTRIVEDSDLRERLLAAGLRHAQGLSWERTARAIFEVLIEAGAA
jgi:glycosyltransferase involved in cell wall biosynthesis